MPSNYRRSIMVVFVSALLSACNLPGTSSTATAPSSAAAYIQTLSALQTQAVLTATSQGVAAPSPAGPVATIPLGTAGPEGATVTNDALCWVGPGPQFTVVSAIFMGTQVELLGRATIPGWFIVRNPIYADPCWIMASDLQLDPSIDVSGLPLFNPPSTPTVTPTSGPVRTPIITVTPAPTNTVISPTITPSPPPTTTPGVTSTP